MWLGLLGPQTRPGKPPGCYCADTWARHRQDSATRAGWDLSGPSFTPFDAAYPASPVAALAAYWAARTEALDPLSSQPPPHVAFKNRTTGKLRGQHGEPQRESGHGGLSARPALPARSQWQARTDQRRKSDSSQGILAVGPGRSERAAGQCVAGSHSLPEDQADVIRQWASGDCAGGRPLVVSAPVRRGELRAITKPPGGPGHPGPPACAPARMAGTFVSRGMFRDKIAGQRLHG
jgi:hypothetical protein